VERRVAGRRRGSFDRRRPTSVVEQRQLWSNPIESRCCRVTVTPTQPCKHLCRDYPPDADVWDLRFHWHAERIRLDAELRPGRFRFGPLSVVTKAHGEVLDL
jgi:hypothetical protein